MSQDVDPRKLFAKLRARIAELEERVKDDTASCIDCARDEQADEAVDAWLAKMEGTTPENLRGALEARLRMVTKEKLKWKQAAEANYKTADDWQMRWQRDVLGYNNEGDAIGGEPACGMKYYTEWCRELTHKLHDMFKCADDGADILDLWDELRTLIDPPEQHSAAAGT